MSDRVAQVRGVYEAVSRGDLEALATTIGPSFEWHPNRGELDSQVRRDSDAVVERIRDFVASFDEFRTDVEEVRELSDQVAVAVRHSGMLAGTHERVVRREAHLWTFSGARVISMREYPDLEAAIEAMRA